MTRALVVMMGLASVSVSAGVVAKGKRDLRPQAKILSLPSTGAGHVHFVTADTVYLDRGLRDGVVVGKPVQVLRGNRVVGECQVTSAADSSAVCTGVGFRAGDRIGNVRAPAAALTLRPALPAAEELDRLRAAVVAQPRALVEDVGTERGSRGAFGISAALSFGEYLDFGSARRSTGIARLDVGLADVRLGHDFAVSAAASLLIITGRPTQDRYPGGAITLLLHQAQARWTPSSLGLILSAGRIKPRHTPGLGALDGAQVAWRSSSGEVEAGLFGGLLPTSALLEVSTSAWAAGAYGSAHVSSGLGSSATTLQVDARAGWASRPVLGSRFEAGVGAHAWLGQTLDAHAQALISGGNPTAPALIDVVGLDVGLHPGERFMLHLAGRYRGNPLLETAMPGVEGAAQKALHTSIDGWFEVTSWLQVGARAGAAFDAVTTGWAGPELALPQLFNGRLVASAGYEEDFSSARGRSVWGQATFAPSTSWRLTARGSWAMQKTVMALGSSDAGGALALEVRPWRVLWFRVSGQWRSALTVTSPTLAGSTMQVMGQVGADF